ncbi:DgyrCDS5578 [Dimorphilus gyrociliatus]|uniref:DgyrCDS5578 n=1 Tax=Dimorphilus gyrociliatus TaxID=2664684 RepID=A0A7I8VKB1_9ANNE|nr:DgyrCDS5578 [Dimorphilus gyrociliatus]
MAFVKRFLYLIVPLSVGLYFVREYFQGCKYTGNERLDDKVVLITGANTGIGKETAKNMALRGARVYMACRNLNKANAARDDLLNITGLPADKIKVMQMDLSSFRSIRNFVTEFHKVEEKLHILINNAGIMFTPFLKTEDGFEMQVGVNHLGHFLLTNLLIDKLKTSAPSRVVTVSSLAHMSGTVEFDNFRGEKGYSRINSYGNSKLMNILFAKELGRRLEGTGVTSYSLHPGGIVTDLQREVLNPFFVKVVHVLGYVFWKTIERGAQTTIYCAVNDNAGKETGLYYRFYSLYTRCLLY